MGIAKRSRLMLKLLYMSARKVIISVLGILVLIGGVVAGVLLIKQRQELTKEAAVPGGQAKVSLYPTSGTFNLNNSFPISIYFNTSGVAISGITVRLTYPYSGINPEITASNISINSIIERSADWNCPTKSVSAEGGNVLIDIACANIGASGYSNNSDTLLATFDLAVTRIPVTNPVRLRFDPSQSIITQKTNGQDILNIPDPQTAEGVYTIGGTAQPTNTPTPTTKPGITVTPTPITKLTITPTPTSRLTTTPTPTLRLTSTPTPTKAQTKGGTELPSAGFGTPTIVGLGLGIILIISSLILAL
jgi:hypothetical protein